MLRTSLLFLYVLSLAITVDGLDIHDGVTILKIKEEQNQETWPLENSDPAITGPSNYSLAPKTGEDTDTYTKFTIVKINASYSELRLIYAFDFENSDDVRTRKFVINSVADGITSEVTVQLQIEDINDHAPSFTNLPATISVTEVIGVGSTLFTISGKDGDGSETANQFNVIAFSIVGGNIDKEFTIEFGTQKSAFLKLNSRLDYDEGPEIYNLTIRATDERKGVNPNGRWVESYLVIQVTDVDDQPAVFTKNVYKVALSETLPPGSFVIQVTAVDKDKTIKGKIVYGLVQETNPDGMFAINETTGNITLVGNLDRNTRSYYALLVSANSTYHDPMHAQVLIIIEDANDHSPNFTSDTYQGQVPENAEVGTLVLVVQAKDLDEGNNTELSYALEGSEATGFYVSTASSLGYIYLNASLDYDLKKIYNFTVTATETLTVEKFNDSATIILEVTEVLANENNPKFNETSYTVNVTEGSLPGNVIQVAATDADESHFGSITYYIIDGSYGMFVIDNQTGWINTTAPLDREDRDSYILVVRAMDGGTFARYTDVLVVVNVLDSNDHSPTFLEGSYTGSVVENSNIGNIVLAVEAKDLDEGSNAMFEFVVDGGDSKFSVMGGGNLGFIIVNGSLDYETHKNFTFLVIAREISTVEKRQSNVSVTISLIDVNDNSPLFAPVSGYTVAVSENSINGTSLLNVSASDADSGTYGDISFSLRTSNVPFSIDSNTGEISVAGSLDRETKDSYALTIEAKDGGHPSLSSYVHVLVNITDVNDHAPVFSQSSYIVTIDENTDIGSNILTVTATDNDQGSNSYLSYFIEGGDSLFKVDSNGIISVNGSLDYESNSSFSFKVIGQESSTAEIWKTNCTVTVILRDVNEFDPVFTQVSYHASVEENKPAGTEVVTTEATDQDGYFKTISYSIVFGNDDGFFTINQTSGVVSTTGPIDSETSKESFVLQIRASDNGSPNRTTETYLVIEIFDINDHSPIFGKSWYNTTIPESLPVETIVLTVKASDSDTNATNSNVRYFVMDSNGKFDVHPTSGQVFVNASLDFETKWTYTFKIFAEESQTSTKQRHNATVFITLTDTNEYDPVFINSSFHGKISENSVVGTSVIQITASDDDRFYNQITYSILSSDDSASFAINGSTGIISTTSILDRETQDKFILTVQATDNGNPGRRAEVTVVLDIMDTNDNQPVFSQSLYNITIPENLPVGTTILTVQGEDSDIGENAEFVYAIVGGDGIFEITDDGVIRTKTVLDYESKMAYTFLVIANETNSSLEPKPNVTVKVILQDVNEFNPVFSQVQYTGNVSENATVGTSVIKVVATDKDGYYNKTSYNIISGGDGRFKINSSTGEIVTNATLDREVKSQFILTVRAEDNGVDPGRTAEAVVVITIVDISDHGPKFLHALYNTTVFENVAVDRTILTVKATDIDQSSNAIIEYSLVDGDGKFRVDAGGNIIVNNSLDYETTKIHKFQVVATEAQTVTGYNDVTNVTVIVKDVNEFNPKFTQSSYTAVVNDSSPVGTQVVKVLATDEDDSDNTITYSILHGNTGDVFGINTTTGWVEVADRLDAENVDHYILTIRAQDSGDSPRTAEILVVININETSRNASFLLQDVYNVTVLENALVDSVVVKLNLRYVDNDIISAFSFAIDGGDGDFGVTQHGEVTVARTLNYESKSSYTFTVIVTEVQPPSGLVANATINIEVKDVNEFNPEFDQDIYHANVSEGDAIGTYVTKVLANDTDGDFNVITYAIIHGNQDNNFTINSTTGVITTATPLDRETQTQFVLTVRASDNGPSPRTSEVVVIVDILDQSEHPPMFLMSNYTAVIDENAAHGTIVLVVKTRDLDTTQSSVTYSLVGTDGKFGVTSEGVIYVNGSLDYETNDILMFLVVAEEASPNSHLRHNATVYVKLRDVNEYNPEFNQTIYSASVKESDIIGTPVLTVFASDEDKDFKVVTYSIVNGNEQGNFSVNQTTGEITLAKSLDRESKHQMILTVRAADNGKPSRTAEVTVVVGIINANDHGPVFSMPEYNASVYEDASLGVNILAVQAVDQDAIPDMLEYQIIGENAFEIKTYYGLGFIVLGQNLDFEQKQLYSFMVYAVEKTFEKRNSSVWVNITVLDSNDNRPVFLNSSYNGKVMEGAPLGTTVLNVSAVDADTEMFGPLYYDIVDGNSLEHFNIDNTTGRLYTSGDIDREKQQEYSIVVEVRDNGSPALTETVTVTITVLDSNDVSPQFIGVPYSSSVPENSAVNTSILTVKALDMDKVLGINVDANTSSQGYDQLLKRRR